MTTKDFLESLTWQKDGKSKNYIHTHTRVGWNPLNHVLTAEKLCINQHGAAYGLGEWATAKNIDYETAKGLSYNLVEEPNWTDFEV